VIREKDIENLEQVIKKILIKNFLPRGGYMAGGTALYYYLNHRVSIDIDCFTPESFRSDLLVVKAREVFDQTDVEIMEENSLVLFLTQDQIKFSLFHYPYPLLNELNMADIDHQVKCPMASLEDIEAMKAIALVQRGSAKDFVDLYHLLKKNNHTFEDLFRLIQFKYQVDEKYDYHLKTAMVYFYDAEPEIDGIVTIDKKGKPRKIKKNEWSEIKDFFMRFCR
jgi:predicted nucleotidyltransferase component of viral defense system